MLHLAPLLPGSWIRVNCLGTLALPRHCSALMIGDLSTAGGHVLPLSNIKMFLIAFPGEHCSDSSNILLLWKWQSLVSKHIMWTVYNNRTFTRCTWLCSRDLPYHAQHLHVYIRNAGHACSCVCVCVKHCTSNPDQPSEWLSSQLRSSNHRTHRDVLVELNETLWNCHSWKFVANLLPHRWSLWWFESCSYYPYPTQTHCLNVV